MQPPSEYHCPPMVDRVLPVEPCPGAGDNGPVNNGSQRILSPCYKRPSRVVEHLGWLALALAGVAWPLYLLGTGQ